MREADFTVIVLNRLIMYVYTYVSEIKNELVAKNNPHPVRMPCCVMGCTWGVDGSSTGQAPVTVALEKTRRERTERARSYLSATIEPRRM